jgi:hypothetical protein
MDPLSHIQARVFSRRGFTGLEGSPSQALILFQQGLGKHTSADVLNQQARYAQKLSEMQGKMQHVKAAVSGVTSTLDGQAHDNLPHTALSDWHGSPNGLQAVNVSDSFLDHAEMCVGPCRHQHGKGICGHLN